MYTANEMLYLYQQRIDIFHIVKLKLHNVEDVIYCSCNVFLDLTDIEVKLQLYFYPLAKITWQQPIDGRICSSNIRSPTVKLNAFESIPILYCRNIISAEYSTTLYTLCSR